MPLLVFKRRIAMRYTMDDETMVNTANAVKVFSEGTEWSGRNTISLATGDEWIHQTLYQSKKGRWYIETCSQWEGSKPRAKYIEPIDAARWLLKNNYKLSDIPSELQGHVPEIEE